MTIEAAIVGNHRAGQFTLPLGPNCGEAHPFDRAYRRRGVLIDEPIPNLPNPYRPTCSLSRPNLLS
jgi:hypothetical protein